MNSFPCLTALALLTALSAVAQPRVKIESGANLPSGQVGVSYSAAFEASGGIRPYLWDMASGDQPPGLSLNPLTGVLAGRPTQAGNFRFGVRVRSLAGDSDTKDFRLQISDAANPLSITTASLPGAQLGTAYSQTLSAAGGNPPYTWTVTAGSLPMALSLSASGTISGTPTAAGTFNFTARVSDLANQTADREFQIVVSPPPLASPCSARARYPSAVRAACAAHPGSRLARRVRRSGGLHRAWPGPGTRWPDRATAR